MREMPATKSYSMFGLTPGTSVQVMSSTDLEEQDLVTSSPNLTRRVMLVFLAVQNATLLAAILFNAAMFAVASFASQVVLARGYRPLIARSPRHRWLMRAWIVIYAFVGIQMGWTLRPFVGAPYRPVQFFRGGEFENAYVIVVRMIWETLIP